MTTGAGLLALDAPEYHEVLGCPGPGGPYRSRGQHALHPDPSGVIPSLTAGSTSVVRISARRGRVPSVFGCSVFLPAPMPSTTSAEAASEPFATDQPYPAILKVFNWEAVTSLVTPTSARRVLADPALPGVTLAVARLAPASRPVRRRNPPYLPARRHGRLGYPRYILHLGFTPRRWAYNAITFRRYTQAASRASASKQAGRQRGLYFKTAFEAPRSGYDAIYSGNRALFGRNSTLLDDSIPPHFTMIPDTGSYRTI
ncbi:hypothetical protein F4820DRAFT_443885 [Hypoxylon rubiginosum]|uniref:Uncharacterized protein n=1 Tax=Hypoxylon rubiginosum TaxID=110542 RepID=A0ACB9ZEK9_9PEZI|nr:hypothetical protein F4820DRAFT_443885 [Hypoxylon rubiginosum]